MHCVVHAPQVKVSLSLSLTRDLVYHKPNLTMGHDHFLGDKTCSVLLAAASREAKKAAALQSVGTARNQAGECGKI